MWNPRYALYFVRNGPQTPLYHAATCFHQARCAMEPLASPSADDLLTTNGGLAAVLPLLYIAWADGLLAPSEIEEIRQKIDALDWMDAQARETAHAWLDPQNPPSATTYYRWIRAIRQAAPHLPANAGRSLADLGVELARFAGNGNTPPEAGRALADIEVALGIVGHEAARELLERRPATPEGPAVAAPFDVAAMKARLDGPHAALRDRVRLLLQDPVFRYDPGLTTTAYRARVFTWLTLLADQGLGALSYPEAVGGAGSMEQFMVAFETIAYHDLSLVIKFGVQFGLFGGSILQLGTEKHHQRYLPAVGTAALPGCFAMSELGHGSNVRDVETTARFDRETDGFYVNTPHPSAHKEWIGNAAEHGRLATVFAQLEIDGQGYGVHAFLVPIRDEAGHTLPRIRIEDTGEKMGLNGIDNGRLWFDNAWIPRENLLDRFASVDADGTYSSPIPSSSKRFFVMLGTLVGGRISVAASALSAAKSGLTIAIRYGNRRRQFGPKNAPEFLLLDYRTHQRRLLPLLATAYALDFALDDLRSQYTRRRSEDDTRAVEGLAAGLKAFSTWNTTRTLQIAREACGGQGYLEVNRFTRLKADTDVFTTFEGDNTVLMLQVAKGLLSEFKQQFHDINFFGLAKHVGRQAKRSLRAKNPLMTRQTDSEHLRDPKFQRAAFRFRERSLLRSVAGRLKKRLDDGMDSFEAFVEVQNHLMALAHAHVERVILDRFIDAIEATEDESLRPVLKTLCDLFALYHLERATGWFQTYGYVEGVKAKAIRNEVEALCLEIRPWAGALVDAFAIPDELLAAPIAT